MLRASISYTRDDEQAASLVVEMQPAQYPLLKWSGIELTYAASSEHTTKVTTLCKSALYGYQAWAESPAALTLRALDTLQTTCSENVPAMLNQPGVTTMRVDIAYRVSEKEDFSIVDSISTRVETGDSEYLVSRGGDDASAWPLEIRPGDAAPLSLALELLSTSLDTPVDLDRYPQAQRVAIDSDVLLHHKDVRSIVPQYAQVAFGVFMNSSSRPARNRDLVGRHQVWEMFRRT